MKRLLYALTRRLLRLLPLPVSWLTIPKNTSPVAYEPDVCAIIERIVKPGWVCVDIGAHLGWITRLLANLVGPGGYVIAFEAHPANVEQLRHNLADWGLARRVRVENMAVSDGTRDVVWLFPGRNRSSAEWNIVGHDVEGKETAPELQVPATALDEYFFSTRHVHFVKIDVEGAEAQVLAGMRHLLREHRPIVLIEFHDDVGWMGRQELYAAGYHLYTMDGRKLNPANDSQRVYHCLALPSEQ